MGLKKRTSTGRSFFNNGGSKGYSMYLAESYDHVANEIMNNSSGWFGTEEDLTNLSNLITCKIVEVEVDEKGKRISMK